MNKGELFLNLYYYDEERAAREQYRIKKESSAYASSARPTEYRSIEKNPSSTTDGSFHREEIRPSESVHKWDSQASSVTDFDVKATVSTRRQNDVALRHDLVTEMKYLFIKVEMARGLAIRDATGSSDPFVEVKVGNVKVETAVISQNLNPVWREVFAIAEDRFSAQFLEITVWDHDVIGKDFLGFVAFEIAEIPERRPPDSPLATQWYKLESRGSNKRAEGEIMLSVWIGTQADEAFPHARQSDSGWVPYTRSKIYLTPRLWYMRVIVHGAQGLVPTKENRFPECSARIELTGVSTQVHRTRWVTNRHLSPEWGEEMLFVVAEPFADEFLCVKVLDKMGPNKDEVLGSAKIPLLDVPRRLNYRPVDARWYDLEREKDLKEVIQDVADKMKGNSKFMSRIQLTICLEGGYHVLDESTHYSSDMRPTDKRLWKPPVAMLELGLIGASGLVPMKNRDGRSCTDAYCVAKYGPKWVRTRTVMDSMSPKWNEQYTWEVYDPCTVLTVGVFDNQHLISSTAEKVQSLKDDVVGKVRIRLSTLETDRTYSHRYPLIVLEKSGVKRKGEIELVVRLTCIRRFNIMQAYVTPLLPKLHYQRPFNVRHVEALREAAMRIVISRLARSEPPLRAEVVKYMLDVDAYKWSFRRSKANWNRISKVFSSCASLLTWFQDICGWKNPLTTVLVHFLYFILVWYPELILPTFFLYMFLIGSWQYRFRPRHPPHMDVNLSLANATNSEELDEEFDPLPTAKSPEIIRHRYDRLRALGGRIQTVIGDLATQLERFHALVNWRDPRATTIFILFCLLAAVVLYLTPFRVIAILVGVYTLRHPRFRDGMPPIPLNFFRRLPALSDVML
ncbi:hypothetical protein KP509_22G069500 [Ceratopteris richardii]|nr:hypothetical protein KP509_22G069500 [Ceratopteris richardii]